MASQLRGIGSGPHALVSRRWRQEDVRTFTKRTAMRQFPASAITALIDESPDVNLSESIGPDLSVADVLGQDGLAALAGVSLGYGTSAGHADLRALIAGRLGVPSEQVLLTSGAAEALFLVARLHSDRGGNGEVVPCLPCYPPMLDVLRGRRR